MNIYINHEKPGANVNIFKKFASKLVFLKQSNSSLCKKLSTTMVYKINAYFRLKIGENVENSTL
jgi:hypothetical protein